MELYGNNITGKIPIEHWNIKSLVSLDLHSNLLKVERSLSIPTTATKVTKEGKQEYLLVQTMGKFSVIWNFQQVKDGSHECYRNQVGMKSCHCYKIVPKNDSVVDGRVMHQKFAVSDSPEAPLVVVTPLKVSSFSISSNRLLCP